MPQRGDPVAQHRARIGVNDGQRQAAFVVLRGGDAVAALLHEEPRPVLQPIVVDGVDVAGDQIFDVQLEFDIHVRIPAWVGMTEAHKPMCLRYCCHSPRTEVSVTRDSFDSTVRPPISTNDERSDAPAAPRWTNPVAAPSSSEMYPAGPTRLACFMRRSVICASSDA